MELIKLRPKHSILSCFVTHNRLEMTKLALYSYLGTIKNPHFLVVVDNGSDKETRDWLYEQRDIIDLIILNTDNKYPGPAVNQGWKEGLKRYPQATLLHRSDNDIFYRANWDTYTIETFNLFPELGLFGLIELSESYFYSSVPEILHERGDIVINKHLHDIGGAYIMRKELWDQGIKHVEEPWSPGRENQEDFQLTRAVFNSEWDLAHATEFLVCHLGVITNSGPDHPDFEYYRQTIKDRGGFVGRLGSHDDTYSKLMNAMFGVEKS